MTDLTSGTGGSTPSPERALLSELDRWRSPLARNAALRNPVLRSWELDACVHDILSRVVYLRICEDRGFLPAGTLGDLAAATGIGERVTSLFLDAEGNTPLAFSSCVWEEALMPPGREPVL
ncbi:MAG: hypothetical protein LUQ64_03415, partial [Methanomicrobiales archaeon]|nr:hypothetical protein [Methanomicrobiales archaeon]